MVLLMIYVLNIETFCSKTSLWLPPARASVFMLPA